jgi:hypothetical protein
MKRFLISAALFALTASIAHADNLPNSVLGKWCGAWEGQLDTKPGAEWTETYMRWDKTCGEDGVFEVKQHEWTAWESGCRFTSVKTVWDPTIPVATKTPLGVQVAHIKAKCGAEGCTWHSSFVLYFSKGTLYMTGRNGKEVCD